MKETAGEPLNESQAEVAKVRAKTLTSLQAMIIDVRVDSRVNQVSDFCILRRMQIRIYSTDSYSAVPNIPIDII